MSIRGLDQWLTEAPECGPEQTIAAALHNDRTIKGYGRRQHGLCGKDADLDEGGQIVIKSLEVVDPLRAENLRLDAEVYCYANICEPDDPERRETAEEIVCTWNDYPGEWTGSDYWTFHHWAKVSVDVTVDEVDEAEGIAAECIFDIVAERLHTAITKHPEVIAFQSSMCALRAAIATAGG